MNETQVRTPVIGELVFIESNRKGHAGTAARVDKLHELGGRFRVHGYEASTDTTEFFEWYEAEELSPLKNATFMEFGEGLMTISQGGLWCFVHPELLRLTPTDAAKARAYDALVAQLGELAQRWEDLYAKEADSRKANYMYYAGFSGAAYQVRKALTHAQLVADEPPISDDPEVVTRKFEVTE